jgi:hypothetical protein
MRLSRARRGLGPNLMVLVFPVMMAVAGVKEPRIAGRAAIGVLKQQIVKEPVFEAVSSRSEESFAATIGAPRGLIVGSGFVHGESFAGISG